MSETFEDFIYINDNVLDENSCKEITDYVMKNDRFVKNPSYPKDKRNTDHMMRMAVKDDYSFVIHTSTLNEDYWRVILQIVHDGLEKYISKWIHAGEKRGYCPIMKYHIVQQHQGYHIWHQEWEGCHYPESAKVLVWHLSLTSHKNEGELEFKYYDRRIEPKAGRLIIWPAGFTHTHRGNSIRSDTQKHYITGWWFVGNKR